MNTNNYRAIQEILNGASIQEAALKHQILPDTLINFLSANFEIRNNRDVKASKLFKSFESHQRMKAVDKKLSSAINNMKAIYEFTLDKFKDQPQCKLLHVIQVTSHIGERVANEVSRLLMHKLKLKAQAEFYETAFSGVEA